MSDRCPQCESDDRSTFKKACCDMYTAHPWHDGIELAESPAPLSDCCAYHKDGGLEEVPCSKRIVISPEPTGLTQGHIGAAPLSEEAPTRWDADFTKEPYMKISKNGEWVRFVDIPKSAAFSEEAARREPWMEFLVGNMCSLCGQYGILDTRGMKTPAGFECGGLHYCICPNGRSLKRQNADKELWLACAKKRAEG